MPTPSVTASGWKRSPPTSPATATLPSNCSGINSYDLAVLDRDIPGPSGDEIARQIVASGSGIPILMLAAADRIDDKASGFELGADDYLTKPFELRGLVMRLRALDRRRRTPDPGARGRRLRLDPFRREVFRDELRRAHPEAVRRARGPGRRRRRCRQLRRAAGTGLGPARRPLHQRRRITVSALRKRLGEPWLIVTVPGVGYRIDPGTDPADPDGADGYTPWAQRSPEAHPQLRRGRPARRRAAAGRGLGVPAPLRPQRVVPRPRPRRPRSFQPEPQDLCACLRPPRDPGAGLPARLRPGGGMDPRRPDARPALSDRRRGTPGRERSAVPPDPAGGPQGRVPRARRRVRHHARTARVPRPEQQRFAANASHELRTPLAISQTLLNVARNDPRDQAVLIDRLHTVNSGRSTSPRPCCCSAAADRRTFTREPVDLSLVAEEAAEALLPLAEQRGSRSTSPARRHRPWAPPRSCCGW